MNVTPVSAVGSGRSSRRAEVAGDNDYDRDVRISRRFHDAEPDPNRRRRPPAPAPAADPIEDEADGDEPRAGAEVDTYL